MNQGIRGAAPFFFSEVTYILAQVKVMKAPAMLPVTIPHHNPVRFRNVWIQKLELDGAGDREKASAGS